jgi:purine-binding chemotaxis protein CheW
VPSSQYADKTKSFVGFVVGSVNYAVLTHAVREITPPSQLTELPHLPQGLVGVFDHRGRVIPVIDLRLCFGVPVDETDRRAKWIVVEVRDRWVGLAVDRVTGVFQCEIDAMRPVPRLGPPVEPRNLLGVVTHARALTFVLDIDAFHSYTLDPDAELPSRGSHSEPALARGRD